MSPLTMFVRHRRAGRRAAVALLTVLLLALSTAIALAHETTVTSSQPAAGSTVTAAPAQVSATFDEELDTQGSTMQVLDASGHQVSEGNGHVSLDDAEHQTLLASLPAALAEGVYTVKWHAVLTDGDASEGEFKFGVQAQGKSLLPAEPAQASAAAEAPTIEAPTASPADAAAAPAGAAEPAPEAQAASQAGVPIGLVVGVVLAAAAVAGVVVVRRGR